MESFFFGNYFYGVCAVALSIEASLQQGFTLNGTAYYGLVFIGTILFYSYPYVRRQLPVGDNSRTNWYRRNFLQVRNTQIIFTAVMLIGAVIFLYYYGKSSFQLSWLNSALVAIFPFVAALYYGINILSGKYNLRKIGWLKPFLIGFTWAGVVTIYPVLFRSIIERLPYTLNLITCFLFLKNFMFISLLCIMFDVKDVASDYSHHVRTYVVKFGLRKTIFGILIPLCVAGLASFLYYAISRHFHPMRIILNIIPFLLLLAGVWSLRKRRSLLYYYTFIDGLMLVKAICGIIAVSYF